MKKSSIMTLPDIEDVTEEVMNDESVKQNIRTLLINGAMNVVENTILKNYISKDTITQNINKYTKDIIKKKKKMSLNKNILTKNYYIAISYYPDNTEDLFKKEELIDMAFSELYTNAQSILRTLSVCGVTGKVLDSTELADLLYVAYNRDSSEIYGVDKAIKAGYDALYTTAPDVIEKKIEELNKLIEKRALDLANEVIDGAAVKSKKRKELEEIEKNQKKMIQRLARTMIEENKEYIGNEIAQEAINDINEKEMEEVSKKNRKRTKKGA